MRSREKSRLKRTAVEKALRDIIRTLGAKADDDHKFDGKEFAFEFVDPNESWAGKDPKSFDPKSFRLAWTWGPGAIENNLGGRRRTDWRLVAEVCKVLCDHFPGQLALVVCDGMSGYHDDAGDHFYDGTCKSFQKLAYDRWPWSREDA